MTEEETKTNCWDCYGTGKIGLMTHPPKVADCPRCDGSGNVPAAMSDWWTRSRAVKEWRLGQRMTTRTHAALLGIDLREYSRMSMGYEDPTRIEPRKEAP